jgi:hypothetical protein
MTIFSMALAATTSVMAWRLVRQEARRSEARVAALASAIYGLEGAVSAETAAAVAGFPSEYPAADAAATPASRLTGRGSLAIVLASVGVVAVAGLLTLAATGRDHGVPDSGAASTNASPTNALSARPTDPTVTAAPLELIALSHERLKDSLIVRGAIRNPANGTACETPAVVVLTFDEHGIFLGSSESDATGENLPPGGRANFTVNVPATTATPARYKVSFRSAGRIVPHVDRRGPGVDAGASDRPSKTEHQAAPASRVHS